MLKWSKNFVIVYMGDVDWFFVGFFCFFFKRYTFWFQIGQHALISSYLCLILGYLFWLLSSCDDFLQEKGGYCLK